MKRVFSEETYRVLENAGWTPFRQLNPDLVSNTITENEFPLLWPVVEFLKKYGELRMKFNHKKSGEFQDFNFDFAKAMDIVVVEGFERYLPRIGCKFLCTIGTAYNDYLILMMDENGIVYGCYEDFLAKVGDNGEMCIEYIVMNRYFQEIPLNRSI